MPGSFGQLLREPLEIVGASSWILDISEETREFLRKVLKSEKNRWEHQVSLQDMVDRLTPLSEDVRAGSEPRVLSLPTIQHLETVIEATLRPDQTVLSALAETLGGSRIALGAQTMHWAARVDVSISASREG